MCWVAISFLLSAMQASFPVDFDLSEGGEVSLRARVLFQYAFSVSIGIEV